MLANRWVARAAGLLAAATMAVHAGAIRAAETAAGAATVPALEVEPFAGGSLAKLGLSLLAVVLLIVGLAWLMRRMGGLPGSTAGALRVLGGLSMGTRERVVLIQVGETQLLLGVAPGRVQTLHVLEHPIAVDDASPAGKSNFAAALGAALQRGKTTS